MMRLISEDEPFEGLGSELGELGGDLHQCLAIGLQRYIGDELMADDALEAVLCELMERPEVTYFYANRKA